MTDNAYDEYDDFLADANRDTRIGDHEAMVLEVKSDTWPSGDARHKVYLSLLTANSAKADMTFSEVPPAAQLKAEAATMDPGKKKAIASNISLRKQLAQFYGVSKPELLASGQVINVKTVKTKVDNNGKGGFIRVVAILPKDHGTNSAPADSAEPPF